MPEINRELTPKKGHVVRNLVAAGTVTAAAVGGWLGFGPKGGSEAPVRPPVATSTPLDTTPDIVAPTSAVPVNEAPKPENELQAQIDKFFNMSDEEFNKYAETNYFILRGESWSFPDWIRGGRSVMTEQNNKLTYNGSTTFDASPNYSVVTIQEAGPNLSPSGDLRDYRLMGFNVFFKDVPILSGEFNSDRIILLGMQFSEAMGGERFILPVTAYANTVDPNDSRNGGRLASPFMNTNTTFGSLHDGHTDGAPQATDKNTANDRLNDTTGLPIMIDTYNQAALPPEFQVRGINDIAPDPSGLLRSLEQILQGDIAGFKAKIEAAAAGGYIITSTHREALSKFSQGFEDINDALDYAPYGLITFLTSTGTPPPSLQ